MAAIDALATTDYDLHPSSGLPYPEDDGSLPLAQTGLAIRALVEAGLAKVAAGKDANSVAVAAGVAGSHVVTFPAGRFTAAPVFVVATLTTNEGAQHVHLWCSGITKDNFTLNYVRQGAALGAATVIQWLAIQV